MGFYFFSGGEIMDSRACAYSFLKEKSKMCDYEIATDELSSLIAKSKHDVLHIDELDKLVYLIYHCNGSIRGKLAIDMQDYLWLCDVYEKYLSKVGNTTKFVLPQGCIGACHLHVLRAKTKSVVRIAYQIEDEGIRVDNILLDFLNLLSNTFFIMALYENKCQEVEEVEFVSKSYGC